MLASKKPRLLASCKTLANKQHLDYWSLAPRTAAQLRQESKFLLLRISTAGPKSEIWLRHRLWAQTRRFGCWAQT